MDCTAEGCTRFRSSSSWANSSKLKPPKSTSSTNTSGRPSAFSAVCFLGGAPNILCKTRIGSGTSIGGGRRISLRILDPFAVLKVGRLVVETLGVDARDSEEDLGFNPGRGGNGPGLDRYGPRRPPGERLIGGGVAEGVDNEEGRSANMVFCSMKVFPWPASPAADTLLRCQFGGQNDWFTTRQKGMQHWVRDQNAGDDKHNKAMMLRTGCGASPRP
jgi:hypothetical protein